MNAFGSTEEIVERQLAQAKRHALRDRQFLRGLLPHFRAGPILELGAGTGHLAQILQEYGREVTASDIAPKFLSAIEARGLQSARVDATQDIAAQTGRTWPNVLAQCIGPLIHRDPARASQALASIHAALEPRGRLIGIAASARRQADPQAYFSPREQLELARSTGLFRVVTWFPHQVVPPGWYRNWNARLLNVLDHRLAYIASARVVWVLEKPE